MVQPLHAKPYSRLPLKYHVFKILFQEESLIINKTYFSEAKFKLLYSLIIESCSTFNSLTVVENNSNCGHLSNMLKSPLVGIM